MTAFTYRPILRRRRFDPWRALGAALCAASALATGVLVAWAAPLLLAVGR